MLRSIFKLGLVIVFAVTSILCFANHNSKLYLYTLKGMGYEVEVRDNPGNGAVELPGVVELAALEESGVKFLDEITAVDESADEKYVELYRRQAALLPSKVVDMLYKYGWRIELTGENLGGDEGRWSGVGYTDFYNHLIKINTDMESKTTLYHEIGHILYEYGLYKRFDKADIDDELSVVFCHDVSGSSYIYGDYYEQIAELFYDFILYPEDLKTQSPVIYEIFRMGVM